MAYVIGTKKGKFAGSLTSALYGTGEHGSVNATDTVSSELRDELKWYPLSQEPTPN